MRAVFSDEEKNLQPNAVGAKLRFKQQRCMSENTWRGRDTIYAIGGYCWGLGRGVSSSLQKMYKLPEDGCLLVKEKN